MSETMQLTVIPATNLPTILAADDKDILGNLAAELADFEADVTTVRGREEIALKARKVATAKMDLIRLGKSLTEGWRKSTKAVNEECAVIEERMNQLRDQVRAPLDEYQDRERRRVEGHEAAIKEIILRPMLCDDAAGSAEIAACLDGLEGLYPDRDWEEFAGKAKTARINSFNALRVAYQNAKTREDEIEAARIAAEEQAEREREAAVLAQIAREERIAAEAAEAARMAAEAEAARKAREAEERAQAALREQTLAAERERAEALRREREAAEALARVEREKQEAIERERLSAEQAEAAKEAAARQAERDRIAAVEAERKRVAEEADRQRKEDEARAADKAHRAKINREVMADLIAAMSEVSSWNPDHAERVARAVVEAIARKQIRHTGIQY